MHPFKQQAVVALLCLHAAVVSPCALHAAGANLDGLRAKAKADQEKVLALSARGRHAEAISLAESTVALAKRVAGESTFDTSLALSVLADACFKSRQFDKARENYLAASKLTKKVLGPEDRWNSLNLQGLGRVALMEEKYDEALAYLQRALKTAESGSDKDDIFAASTLQYIGYLHVKQGKRPEGVKFYQQALTLVEKSIGKATRLYLGLLSDCSKAYYELDELDLAEAGYLECIELWTKMGAGNDPILASNQLQLARVYVQLNNNDRAEERLKGAITIYDALPALPTEDHYTALFLLGKVHLRQLKFAEAESITLRAKAVAEQNRATPQSMATINLQLGDILFAKGDRDNARRHFEEAVSRYESILGPESVYLISPLSSLFELECRSSNLDVAESIGRRILTLAEKRGDEEGLNVARTDLCGLLAESGKLAEAIQLAELTAAYRCQWWENLLKFGSEEQLESSILLAYGANLGPKLHSAQYTAREVLRYKGSIASALGERQARALSANQSKKVRQLREVSLNASNHLAALHHAGASGVQVKAAHEKAEVAEKALNAELKSGPPLLGLESVNANSVASKLPSNSVLVEFFVDHEISLTGVAPPKELQGSFAAVVIAPGQEAKMVRLGSGEELAKLRHSLTGIIKYPPKDTPQAQIDESTKARAQALYAAVVAPLESSFPPGTDTLFLSPDSFLHSVPFASLVDQDGKFLCEKYALHHLASGRDLLKKPLPNGGPLTAVCFGNPDYFDLAPKGRSRPGKPPLAAATENIDLPQLPGSGVEAAAFGELFTKAGWKTRILEGSAASEKALRSLNSPTILHLATHGFFLRDSDGTFKQNLGPTNSPYADSKLRSGFALAGGSTSFRLWSENQVAPFENDGIFTAGDASQLDLRNTQLVTLSACETNLGLDMPGMGVSSLQQSLLQAGAQHVMTTMWPISDVSTVKFMDGFYVQYLKTQNPVAAMNVNQRKLLREWVEDHGWHFAIGNGAPFILTSSRL